MEIHWYLSVSPIEALIASHLEPEQFGSYMAIGSDKNGSQEYIVFLEIEGNFGSNFDWDYAKKQCVPHKDGRPKNSVWLSTYRALEYVPLQFIGDMYLTTQDGRTLKLQQNTITPSPSEFYVYQELAPVTPLVVSALSPQQFSEFMTNPKYHTSVPHLIFCDIKVVSPEKRNENIGPAYNKNIEHLKKCIIDVKTLSGKPNKNLERSKTSFSYRLIQHAVYLGSKDALLTYPMPTIETLRLNHYDWGKSAMIF
jgi:hypothetical protein